MYVWIQQTCSPAQLASALNRLELDGWEVFQILPGTQPIIVANRPAEREELEAAISQSPAPAPEPAKPAASTSRSGLDAEVRALVQSGRKILAIKLVRERTGKGLKESKAYVEAL